MKKFLVNLLLVPASILFAVFLFEGLSAAAFYTDFLYPVRPSDHSAFRERFPATLRLSKRDIALLRRPMDSIQTTTYILLEDLRADGKGLLETLEFYEGNVIHRVKSYRSENDVNLYYLKDRAQVIYPGFQVFLTALSERLKHKRLIVTFGGSTTAYSFNWPGFLEKIFEEHYPGRFIVLNMGQPGWVSWQHALLLENILYPAFEKFSIEPDSFIYLDGTNDTSVPMWHFLSRKVRRIVESSETEKINDRDISVHPTKVLTEYAPPGAILDRMAASLIKDGTFWAYRVMPYTSAWIWRKVQASPRNFHLKDHPDQLAALGKDRNGDGQRVIRFSPEAQGRIQEFFAAGIERNVALSAQKGMPFYYFLQPVAVGEFYPLVKMRHARSKRPPAFNFPYRPSIDYYFKIEGFWGAKTDVLVDFEPLFKDNQRLFEKLKTTYGCCFYDITHLYAQVDRLEDDLYGGDAVHYNPRGSQWIAETVFKVFATEHLE